MVRKEPSTEITVNKLVAQAAITLESGNLSLTSGAHLKLPQVNEPATPTLAFGDGDSGLYEAVDDTLVVAINGVANITFNATSLHAASTVSWRLLQVTSTATVPNILSTYSDTDTGIGSAGADILSLIAGAVEGHRITEVAGLIDHVLTGMVKTPTTQTLTTATGAGAIDIVNAITHIVSTGVDALSLADGAEGQHKFIVMKTDNGDATLTPTHPGNFATILFDAVGDSAQLLFTNAAWHFMGGTATLG